MTTILIWYFILGIIWNVSLFLCGYISAKLKVSSYKKKYGDSLEYVRTEKRKNKENTSKDIIVSYVFNLLLWPIAILVIVIHAVINK